MCNSEVVYIGDHGCTCTGILQRCCVRVELWMCVYKNMYVAVAVGWLAWMRETTDDQNDANIAVIPLCDSLSYSSFKFALQQSLEYCFTDVIFAKN